MDNKNLDGINKFNKDEIDKSRKIVLDYINNHETKKKNVLSYLTSGKRAIEKNITAAKKIDGLFQMEQSEKLNINNSIKEQKNLIAQPEDKELIKNEANKTNIINNKLKPAVKKQPKKKVAKKLSVVKKPSGREQKEDGLKHKKSSRNIDYKKYLKKFFYTLIILIIIFAVIYFLFAMSLLNFNIDNKYFRKVAAYIPVPALISKIGFIDYYNYHDSFNKVKKSIQNEGDLNNFKLSLIRELILKDLAGQYNIRIGENKGLYGVFKEELNKNIILDKKINKVAISRIDKINQLISSGQDFKEIGEKYGDEFISKDYINKDEAMKIFGRQVEILKLGGISEVIPFGQGLYIINLLNENAYSYKLQSIFIKAKTLDDYLAEKLSSIKVWSLVD